MRDTRVFLCSTEYVTAVSDYGIRRSLYLHDWNAPLYTRNTFYHLEQFAGRLTMSLHTRAHVSGKKIIFQVSGCSDSFASRIFAQCRSARGRRRDVQQVFCDERILSQGETLIYKLHDVLVITKLPTKILKKR